MKKLLASSAIAAAAALMAPAAANATVWVSQLEYDSADTPYTPVSPSYGTVTLEDGLDGGTRVRVTVELTGDDWLFVDTGQHVGFAFNLDDSPNSSVSVVSPLPSSWNYLGEGSYEQPPFATGNDGDRFTNAFECCGKGSSNGEPPTLVFDVTNASGITFAGLNYTVDSEGRLTGLGTGNHFVSTEHGWWFSADICDDGSQQNCTFAVAARDAITGGIPEPTTWALMIMGFGGAGAMLRRRRAAFA